MTDIHDALLAALSLVADLDATLSAIVLLSLTVSLSAVAIACAIGMPLGAVLALWRFPGRTALLVVINALLGFPPVVAGLLVYLVLSRAGPLGSMGLLFTPGAMVIAQAILVVPIIAALVHRAVEGIWAQYGDALLADGASKLRAIPTLLAIGRASLVTAALVGFGRAISEVGAVLIVGGNIAGVTRTMTTAIALETSRGDLALALGLGVILLALTLTINAGAQLVAAAAQRATA